MRAAISKPFPINVRPPKMKPVLSGEIRNGRGIEGADGGGAVQAGPLSDHEWSAGTMRCAILPGYRRAAEIVSAVRSPTVSGLSDRNTSSLTVLAKMLMS